MCAIFAFIAKADRGPKLETLASIARGNIHRGPHAFGFSWIDQKGRMHCYKQVGRLVDHLGLLTLARDARMLIGHLRWATHGDPSDNANNHPHPVDGGWLVHNGVVTNYNELLRQKGLLTVSECDSEVLGLLVELDKNATMRTRVAGAVRKTTGNLAMLGLWSRPASMIAARRGNPLHLVNASEGVYLATLADSLHGKVMTIPDDQVIEFTRWHGRVVTKKLNLPTSREARATLFDGAYCGG